MTVEIYRRAVFDANFYRRFYQRTGSNVANRFAAELKLAFDEIGRVPLQWPPHILGTRCYALQTFPFSVVYIIFQNRCLVIAITHHKRRPNYWKRRLKK